MLGFNIDPVRSQSSDTDRCTVAGCGRRVGHRIWDGRDGSRHDLCCYHYVMAGNCPADWHPICMATYNQMKEEKKI